MRDVQARTNERTRSDERDGRLAVDDGARARLLAGLPVTERRLELAGIATAVLEGGAGPPVVLLHGPEEHGAKWFRVIPDLVTTNRVIAPDLPGHGSTDAIDGPTDADRVLAWLDDLIECTCPTPPALVGHALGGAIAARFAIDHGERIGALVLVDALGLSAFHPSPEFGLALHEFIAMPSGDTHDRLWSRCAFDFEAMRDRMGDQWERLRAYTLDRAGVPSVQAALATLMEQFGIAAIDPARLSRIAVPTTLIWGRHDVATPLAVARATSARYGWPLEVIEHAGGDPAIEQPAALIRALRAALETRGGAPVANAREGGHGRAAWDRIAPGYDRTNTPTQMWLGSEGIRRAGLRAGMRFLDVAAGSGALGIPAARAGARVLATDLSPVMLELLRARARDEKLTIETRVMDGHALELDDDSFDMAGSQFGVMLFPDMPRGIREMVRVVAPGGLVLLHAYGDPHRIDFLGFLIEAVRSVRPEFDGPPMDPPPLEFQLADPARMRDELASAGLRDIRVETITETTEFASGEALWDWLVSSNPIVESVLGTLDLSADEVGVIRRRLGAMVRDRAGSDSAARLTSPINIGIGTK